MLLALLQEVECHIFSVVEDIPQFFFFFGVEVIKHAEKEK
jgi:hypothetical protein